MRHTLSTLHRLAPALAATLLVTACGSGSLNIERNALPPGASNVPEALQRLVQYPSQALCPDTGVPGMMHCLSLVRSNDNGSIQALSSSSGFGPSDLVSAYALPTTGGSGITVAIVDAQDDPSAESDLATYRSNYGLPPCTTANGCFRKVNQNGQQSNYPSADSGWAGEIALDLDMVSAVCPSCNILLVEADSATMANLGTAVNTAVSLGAQVVSNSYGGSESSSDTSGNSQYFNHPGVAIFASSGDNGYGVEYPAASPNVTAVGGTALAQSGSSSRGWVESAWGSANGGYNSGGAGSGCSSYEPKPSFQTDSGCGNRMVADVSAVADPNTGVAVYDSYGSGGWVVVGGTSVASPLVAGIFALTGHVSDALGYAYGATGNFYDVTSGSNGTCSGSPSYFCNAVAGYDGPTGVGTPNGTAMAGGSGGGTGGGGGSTPSFSLSLNPSTGSGTNGDTVSYTVTTSALGSTAPSVSLSVAGLPSGVTGSFNPSSVTAGSSSTLSLTIGSSATAGSTTFSVTGAAGTESHSASGTLTVTTSTGGGGGGGGSGGGTTALTNGVPLTGLSGAQGAQSFFTLDVPSGASSLTFTISGGTGDADLYVKFGSQPTLSSYDCRPYVNGNNETCNMPTAAAGTWYVMLNGYQTFSGVSLTGSFSTSSGGGGGGTGGGGGGTGGGNTLTNGVPLTGLSGAKSSKTYFTLDVPSGASSLTFQISGGSGDADLYVRFGSQPTTSSYDCRPYVNGNNETCNMPTATQGTWYVMINGYRAYSGLSLVGSFSTSGGGGGGGGTGGGGGNVLTAGVPITGLSGSMGSQAVYSMDVPSGASYVTISISGGTGDADLYVKQGSAPTLTSYDCRPYLYGNNEQCDIPVSGAGTWYVMINGYQSYSGVTLSGDYQ